MFQNGKSTLNQSGGETGVTTKHSDLNHLLQDADEFADSTLGFWHAFVASISVILVSEIGDKTFFIAAIMAMRHSRMTVFAGALSALFLMTVLSGKACFRILVW